MVDYIVDYVVNFTMHLSWDYTMGLFFYLRVVDSYRLDGCYADLWVTPYM